MKKDRPMKRQTNERQIHVKKTVLKLKKIVLKDKFLKRQIFEKKLLKIKIIKRLKHCNKKKRILGKITKEKFIKKRKFVKRQNKFLSKHCFMLSPLQVLSLFCGPRSLES